MVPPSIFRQVFSSYVLVCHEADSKPGWCFAILPPVNEAFCCHSDDSSCSSAVLIITLSAFKGSVTSRVANEGAGTLTMRRRWDKPPARITGDTPTASPIRSCRWHRQSTQAEKRRMCQRKTCVPYLSLSKPLKNRPFSPRRCFVQWH